MPKLKLSGRKLCTTGRKLAVCGCTPTFQCCQNGGNCRFAVPNSPFSYKTWTNFSYSGTYSEFGVIGAAYSGSCERAYSSPNFTVSQRDNAGPCSSGGSATATVFYESAACSVPASATGGTVQSNTTIYIPNSPDFPGGPSLATVAGWDFGGGAGGVQTSTLNVRVTNIVDLRAANGFRAQSGFDATIGINAGVPYAVLTQSWTGTITPSLILDGSCLVGIRADFNASRTFPSGPFPNHPLVTQTMSGYSVVAICNKLVGCTGSGITCGSTPPGALSLSDDLDAALFS